ncbi:Golgi phosphoprotein 3 GPP34 [Salana multivorans]|uniref:Golgi phosphoprotein 3 GPP34 n=2 Tax=Salana multivorans TaxID=120377 RepID=A0A3N2DCY7_9MICO|nr:Golgi phosphoprotein 3 GPP34 [Salana multivorans]
METPDSEGTGTMTTTATPETTDRTTDGTLASLTAARLLVASIDSRGRTLVVHQQLRPALVAATMIDAERAGLLVTAFDGRHTVLRRTPETASDGLLAAVVDGCDGRTVQSAVNRLALSTWSGGAVDLRRPLLELLAADGVLRREPRGGLARERWFPDPEVQRLVVAPVLTALCGDVVDETVDPGTAALVAAAAVSTQLVHRIVRTHAPATCSTSPRVVRRRAARVLEAEPLALATHRALAAMMGAAAA